MSYAFDLYYAGPADPLKEATITETVLGMSGEFEFREEPTPGSPLQVVTLSYEFTLLDDAELAADLLRSHGHHVEGPYPYG